MEKKIEGVKVYFNLNDEGLIACRDFGITATTFDECEKLVKEHIKSNNEVAKRNSGKKVMVVDWRGVIEIGSLGKEDGDHVWFVSDKGKREKERKDNVFILDLDLIKKIEYKREEIKNKESELAELINSAVSFYEKVD